jgi:hypothetical protein
LPRKDDADILANYLDGERLKVIPRKRSRKRIVLEWLVERFDFGVDYTEHEVNELIQRSHPDFATLRRELYDAYLMDRHDGIYRRTQIAPPHEGSATP